MNLKSPLILFFMLLLNNTSHALKCDRLFWGSRLNPIQENRALESLSYLETRQAEISNKIRESTWRSDFELELAKVRQGIDSLLNDITSGTETPRYIETKYEGLLRTVERLEKEFLLEVERRENRSFDELVENPLLVVIDRIYTVHTPSGDVRVSFNKEVVDAVFRSENPYRLRAADLFLRSLSHGFHTVNNKGIVKLTHADSSLYEVKILGRAIGNERISGYFIKDLFRIVYYTDNHMNVVQFSHTISLKVKNDRMIYRPSNSK